MASGVTDVMGTDYKGLSTHRQDGFIFLYQGV